MDAAVVELDALADPVRSRRPRMTTVAAASSARRGRPARTRGSSRESEPRTRPRRNRRPAGRGAGGGRAPRLADPEDVARCASPAAEALGRCDVAVAGKPRSASRIDSISATKYGWRPGISGSSPPSSRPRAPSGTPRGTSGRARAPLRRRASPFRAPARRRGTSRSRSAAPSPRRSRARARKRRSSCP